MTKHDLAEAMYETMLAMGERRNLGFERQAATFKLLNLAERNKWLEWAETVITRVAPSNVEMLKPRP